MLKEAPPWLRHCAVRQITINVTETKSSNLLSLDLSHQVVIDEFDRLMQDVKAIQLACAEEFKGEAAATRAGLQIQMTSLFTRAHRRQFITLPCNHSFRRLSRAHNCVV